VQNKAVKPQINDVKRLCPILDKYCTSECAWYMSKKERCAVWAIANSK